MSNSFANVREGSSTNSSPSSDSSDSSATMGYVMRRQQRRDRRSTARRQRQPRRTTSRRSPSPLSDDSTSMDIIRERVMRDAEAHARKEFEEKVGGRRKSQRRKQRK